jgi:hypothetical protein
MCHLFSKRFTTFAVARRAVNGCRLILLTALCVGLLLVLPNDARAQTDLTGKTIEFIGNFRAPGQPDESRNVPIAEPSFADEARAEPPCTLDDFANGVCRTQYQDFPPAITPISVEEALTGLSYNTSYSDSNGDLVLTFTDFLPVNGAGADLALFQGFTERGFAIKVRVRTSEGVTEYPTAAPGYTDISAVPFIQITGLQIAGSNEPIYGWGPCRLEYPLDTCGDPNYQNYQGLLLLYEIDLDDLGVPADAVVEDVVIRKKQSDDSFGTVPYVVMVGALNGDYAGPGPRPDPEDISGMIHNGFFDDGLDEWTVDGPGSVEVVQTVTGPAVEIATDTETTSLSQAIDTPDTSFVISFEYRFATNDGSVDVLLNGTKIDTLEAQISPIYRHRDILVNDPNLMGVSAAELSFNVHPGTLDDFLLGHIVSPNYELLPSAVAISGSAKVDRNGGPDVSSGLIEKICNTETPGCQGLGGGLFVSGETPFLDVPDSDSTASMFARSFAFLEGVGIGVRGFAQSDGALVGQELRSSADINRVLPFFSPPPETTYAVVRYQAISAENVQGRYPINYRLNIAGQVDFVGDLESETNYTKVEYLVNGTVAIYRARLGLSQTVPFAFVGGLTFGTQAAGSENDEIAERDDFKDGSNCIDDPNDNGPPPPPVGTPPVGDPIDGPGNSRTYVVNFAYCSPEILYARVGDQVEVRLSVGLHVAADPQFGGYVNADFSRTATASISTDVPGIQFVPVDFSVDETNLPPAADAGPDQTVAADASCSASVNLDGSGSSDPDGDALTYTWTGPFGTATGVNPTVALGPGSQTVTLTVDDGKGGTATDMVVITVEDQTPPLIGTLTASPHVLWPPNHKLIPISVQADATDNCGTPRVVMTSVTTNEGGETTTFDPTHDSASGDGNTPDDVYIDIDGNLSLRSERSGTGSGRIYIIVYTATDDAGNTSNTSTTVAVPHDQRHGAP